MFWWLLVAILLYILCAAALIAEVFVPSGGLLTLIAMACLAGGLYIFFHYSPVAGWIGVLLAVIMIPTVLIIAYKIFPQTKFGQTVVLTPADRRHGDGIPDGERLQQLPGKAGVAITPLRPVGTCEIDGKRYQCVAESGFIEKGKSVSVIVVEGARVVVAVKHST
jgi:membrane-bound serine protease (ClpP class)